MDKPHSRGGGEGRFLLSADRLGVLLEAGVAAQYSMAFAWTLGCMQGELWGEMCGGAMAQRGDDDVGVYCP